MKLIAFLCAAALLSGCSQVDRLSDDELASALETGARNAVKYSLKAALNKVSADDALRISKDALAADQVITQNLVPALSGTDTATVLRSAVDTALSLLKDKVTNPKVVAAIDLGIEVIAVEVNLPKNPADKLDDRTRKAILGVFVGISEGIRLAIAPKAEAPEAARDTMSLPK